MMFDSSYVIGAPVKDSHGKMAGFINEVMVDSGGTPLQLSSMQPLQMKIRSSTVMVKTPLYPSSN